MGTDTDKLAGFFKQIAPALTRIARGQSAPLGFNAFALVSDYYYRETFHSDILKEILDPKSAHGEGALFLRLFVDFLATEADRALRMPGTKLGTNVPGKLRALAIDESTTVEREKGKIDRRIDIKITASNGTIVIENKIYDAPDMYRQLPKYVEYCRDRGEDVVAVVYLTAAGEKRPDRSTWKHPEDDDKVDPLLLFVSGYSNGVPNLAQGWVERCELAARGFNTRSILDQYAELLRHQSGETMESFEVANVLQALGTSGINYTDLLDALNAAPTALAQMICSEFQKPERKNGAGYSAVKIYSGTTAFFELAPIEVQSADNTCQNVVIHIDIRCDDMSDRMISFFAYLHDKWNTRFLELLKEYDGSFYQPSVQDRLYLPFDRNDAFRERAKLFDKVSELLRFLKNNRPRLEAICRKANEEEEGSTDADA